MLYHKTKDILFVKEKMGHRRLEHTLIYTHLVNFKDDQFTVRTASTLEEAVSLLENGFEYVCDRINVMMFRKPK